MACHGLRFLTDCNVGIGLFLTSAAAHLQIRIGRQVNDAPAILSLILLSGICEYLRLMSCFILFCALIRLFINISCSFVTAFHFLRAASKLVLLTRMRPRVSLSTFRFVFCPYYFGRVYASNGFGFDMTGSRAFFLRFIFGVTIPHS